LPSWLSNTKNIGYWHDKQFRLALVAAPAVWGIMLWLFSTHAPPIGQALSTPGQWLLLAVVYPCIEEIVFRGMLQGHLRNYPWGLHKLGLFSTTNTLTSMVFTGLHFFTHPPLIAFFVFIPSLIFGYFRDRNHHDSTQGLAAPVILHCWYNAGYFFIFGIASSSI